MESLLCSAAPAADSLLSSDSQDSVLAASGSKKHDKKKHSGNAFLTLCEDFCNARIELDAEVFSGAQMVALLLDEIEYFLHGRCGSIKGVLKLLANRGIVLTERTLKEYLYRARRLKGTEKGNAVAKLRESIFEEARMSGRAAADRSSALGGSQQESAPLASDSLDAGASPAEVEWDTPDGGWLNDAVLQAMEQNGEKVQEEKTGRPASSAKKDKQAKKRAKRRARRSR